MPHRSRQPAVSVLIPTRNAGAAFVDSLRAIEGQRGVQLLEVLVADSGSTDETVSLARKAGAQVLEVDPVEFNHGRVRNQLAERSRGEVLLFTVQDAVLRGRDSLGNAVRTLVEEPAVAAVSARQLPGPDADLHGRFVVWSLNESLASCGTFGPAADREAMHGSMRLSESLVDNVCAAVRRSAWEDLRFRELDFAEDIDFGLRATERGWRTQFAADAAVTHHHDRDAAHSLARNAVVRQRMGEVVEDLDRMPAARAGIGALAAGIRGVLRSIEGARALALEHRPRVRAADCLEAMVDTLQGGGPEAEPSGELAAIDELLRDRSALRHFAPDEEMTATLSEEVIELFMWEPLRRFLQVRPGRVDRDAASAFVARLVGSRLGWTLGEAMCQAPQASLVRRIHERLHGSGAGGWGSATSDAPEELSGHSAVAPVWADHDDARPADGHRALRRLD